MSIVMGNDEFILHIRKQYPNCTITNDQLGKSIWQWLRNNPDAEATIIEDGRDQPCMWGDSPGITSDTRLPKTATQFRFSIEELPRLYRFIGNLASGRNNGRP